MNGFARRSLLNMTGSVTAVSFLGALRPMRNAQAAESASAWNVKGTYMEACNCEALCPCEVASPPTAGFCTVLVGFHIESGRRGDVPLDGLNAVKMIHSPGDMGKGQWKQGFYIDERATAPQREAMTAIFTSKPGGAFASSAAAVATDLGVRFVPITLEANGKQRKLRVSGIADAEVTAIAGMGGNEVLLENGPFWPVPVVAARSTRATYNDHDIQLDVSGKNGFYSPFTFSST